MLMILPLKRAGWNRECNWRHCRSSEQSLTSARANVMIYDDAHKKWVPSGSSSGPSKVHIYQHMFNNTFRVVGRKLQDQEVSAKERRGAWQRRKQEFDRGERAYRPERLLTVSAGQLMYCLLLSVWNFSFWVTCDGERLRYTILTVNDEISVTGNSNTYWLIV